MGLPRGHHSARTGWGGHLASPSPKMVRPLPCCHCQAHGAQEALTLEAQLWICQGPSTTFWTWEHSPLSLRLPSPRNQSGQEIGLPPISGGAGHCPAREEGCVLRTGALLGGSAEWGQLGLTLTETSRWPWLPCSVWAAWGQDQHPNPVQPDGTGDPGLGTLASVSAGPPVRVSPEGAKAEGQALMEPQPHLEAFSSRI